MVVGPQVVLHPAWRDDLEARFAGVARAPDAPPVEPHTEKRPGPDKKWLLQFQVWHMFITRYVCLFKYFDSSRILCLPLAAWGST